MIYRCNCGAIFSKSMELRQHIGLLNPHWPRSSPEDEHWAITEQEWRDRRAIEYSYLRGDISGEEMHRQLKERRAKR